MSKKSLFIKEIVSFLAPAFNAQSILCYGSYAHLMHDEKSDIDLLILTDENLPSEEVRRNAYNRIPNVHIIATDKKILGEWDTSWTPINDQLLIKGQAFEVGYNTTTWVNCVIEKLISNHQITFAEFPFRPYTFLGLLESSLVIYDKNGFIEKRRSRIRPIPRELKKEIVNAFLPVLLENFQDLIDCSERNIGILAFEYYLFRGLDAAIQLLFIINDVYDPASKRTEAFLFKLAKLPPKLEMFITKVLPRFYENKEEVCAFFKEMIQFIHKSIESQNLR